MISHPPSSKLLLNVSDSVECLFFPSHPFQSVAFKRRLQRKKKEYQESQLDDEIPIEPMNDKNAFQLDQLLQLTMDWDCIDVAKKFVLENSLTGISPDVWIF